jgi:ArsR family transcriptional regulator, arsenate/arsenite/antimonite-responsive transcriptional repressor
MMKEEASIFKALADETRLRILALLLEGELCVCDLMTILQLPQSTVSRHLAYLRNTGWVLDRRQGMWMFYRLADNGKPLHGELIQVLRRHLATLPAAARDLAALREFAETDSCHNE